MDRLIDLVGGRDNIATVSHCITRLRFVLHQPANARPKEIEQFEWIHGAWLGLAIMLEIAANVLLKFSDGFRRKCYGILSLAA
ncbi:SMR family transporter, partial [Salmonella enterica subsp. enterica serovar Cerro]|nr:SMR family transporter [Salmonella enterica subsp. enterica serovar Cerro]